MRFESQAISMKKHIVRYLKRAILPTDFDRLKNKAETLFRFQQLGMELHAGGREIHYTYSPFMSKSVQHQNPITHYINGALDALDLNP